MVVNTLFMFADPLLCLLVLRTKEHILQRIKSSHVTETVMKKRRGNIAYKK